MRVVKPSAVALLRVPKRVFIRGFRGQPEGGDDFGFGDGAIFVVEVEGGAPSCVRTLRSAPAGTIGDENQ
jgi:hypothetical protein